MPEQGRDGKNKFAWITDDHRRRAIDALTRARRRRAGDRPRLINDFKLGVIARVPGKQRETIRRRVRELCRDLESQGLPIVAVRSSRGGRYLAEDATDHAMYRAAFEAEGKRRLARAANLKLTQSAADAAGQFSMFDTTPEEPVATHRY